MSRFLTRLGRICFLVGLAWVASPVAHALEPVTIEVDGIVPAEVERGGSPRDRAFAEAMVEAVFLVGLRFLPPEAGEHGGDLRELLRPRAPEFVLSYRVAGALRQEMSLEDDSEQVVLPVRATVDAGQLRAYLETLGLLESPREKPSVVLFLRLDRGISGDPRPAPLVSLERFLQDRLSQQGLVVVEPALRANREIQPESALALGRDLGADVALDVALSWRPKDTGSRVKGGVAEVRVRAVRVGDGTELALARFEGAGYHDHSEEAFARGVGAVREQLVDNVILQLDRNWQALAEESGAVEVRLFGVSNLLQVTAVRGALKRDLGADRAALMEMSPGTAFLRVEGALSPGALQDRLAALEFSGFRLEPVLVEAGRVELRVEPVSAPAMPQDPSGVQ
ncbi:MAG: hypothetical protein GY725_16745 [bacterium]|nr:hypothetical protein [bacterium]